MTTRFSRVSRRAFLAGASMAAVAGVAGCSSGSDAEALGSSSSSDPTNSATKQASSTAPVSTGSATSSASGPASSAGGAVPTTAKLSVAFTYAASGGGFVKNPYVAVWVEDSSGALVATIALWYLQGEGDRWLNSLSRWYQVAGGNTTNSSGTRQPGDFTVEWDAKDLNGATVAAGNYYVCIEASREHGPYELIRTQMSLGADGATKDLGAQGELTKANATWSV